MNRFFLITLICISSLLLANNNAFAQVIDENDFGIDAYNQGFNYSSGCNDIVNSVNYYYLSNNKAIIHVGTTTVGNGQIGSKYPGAMMDMVLKSSNLDNLDWTQFMLTDNETFDLNNLSNFPIQDSIAFKNKSLNFYGKSRTNSNIKFQINYSLLPDLPIVKYKVKIFNKSSTKINKYLTYVIDVDEYSYDYTYVPTLGYNTGDYTKTPLGINYIYYGPQNYQNINNNVHGLSWIENTPTTIVSNSLYFGMGYKVDLNANDSLEIVFYQLVDLPYIKKSNQAHVNIENLSQKILFNDPDLLNKYHIVKGKLEDQNSKPVSGVNVKIIDDKCNNISTLTDQFGNFSFTLNKNNIDNNSLKMIISAIGYKVIESKLILNKTSNTTTKNFTKSLKNNLVTKSLDASFNKTINVSGAVSYQPGDLVIENNSIVLVIANSKRDNINLGDIIDFYSKNYTSSSTDLLDWFKPNKLGQNIDSLDAWWLNNDLLVDTLFVKSINDSKIIVRLEAKILIKNLSNYLPSEITTIQKNDSIYTILKNLKYITEYELLANSNLININSKIINTSNLISYDFYIGDALKTLGPNVRSYLPEKGEVKNDFGQSSDFIVKTESPWLAHYGREKQVFGIIYEQNIKYKYAVKRWASFKDRLHVKARDSVNYQRYLTLHISRNDIQKEALIKNEYYQLNKNKMPITITAEYANKNYKVSDSLVLKIIIENNSNIEQKLYLDLVAPQFLTNNFNLNLNYTIGPNAKLIKYFKYMINEGGRDDFRIIYRTDSTNTTDYKLKLFISDRGWFAADNHTHSTFSDGASSIENNLLYARSRNISIMTATDHNSVNHFNEVKRLSSKYKDMLILPGNEVTTALGHFLAYNINTNLPWVFNTTWSQQNMLDSVNKQTNKLGNGFMYVAHPFDPSFYWRRQNINGLKGLEVWNSYNLNFDFTDIESKSSFHLWDSLNLNNHELFGIANSDAHNAIDVGSNFTRAYLTEFTNEEVVKVYRDKGCFYGSNGPHINFTINNNMMGSKLYFNQNQKYVISIKANTYHHTNKIYEIRLIRNGILYRVWYPNSNTFNAKFVDSSAINSFYRVELVSNNNTFAFSNPIWIKMINKLSADVDMNHANKIFINKNNQIDIDTSKSSNITKQELVIYPVPSKDMIFIKNLNRNQLYDYALFNTNGTLIQRGTIDWYRDYIDLSQLNNGVYLISILSEDTYEKKLIKVER